MFAPAIFGGVMTWKLSCLRRRRPSGPRR
jgi:hypothetical protein